MVGLLVYFVAKKTLWDLLQLLIVPLVLAVIGVWFTAQQDARQQQLAELRAQNEAVQAYLNEMSSLLLTGQLRVSTEDSEVRTLARARTLTILGYLDPEHNNDIMRFLYEAHLIDRQDSKRDADDRKDPVVDLTGAYISFFDLNLNYADLSGVNLVVPTDNSLTPELVGADLGEARLHNAYLWGTKMEGANLNQAILMGANMRDTSLSNANLEDASRSTEKSWTPGSPPAPSSTRTWSCSAPSRPP